MEKLNDVIAKQVAIAIETLYGAVVPTENISVDVTNPAHPGDYTVVVFPFLKVSKKSPEATATEIGEKLIANADIFASFNVIKGFLNLEIASEYFCKALEQTLLLPDYGFVKPLSGEKIVVEYSSPNTNKPLHLGHIRNNLLGHSVSEILKANGHRVVKVNLVNDRGIHICKTMLAWQKWGNAETPETQNQKGDHFVGYYYVHFEKNLKREMDELMAQGMTEEQARDNSRLMQQAREMLRKWEDRDQETIKLWRQMNAWVYEGFEQTYQELGISFDKTYYESETWMPGKKIVLEGLKNGVFVQKEDGSVWVDLSDQGQDEKILLRADGTSVYITQDLGSAEMRMNDFEADSMVYVVGSEQDYHFDVLKKTLKKAGREWADRIYHLSYGMVELPEGKMKSREGKVVDADDLVTEMVTTAGEITKELGKAADLSHKEAEELFKTIGIGALKYFLLKVDPKKKILFNPQESIDFNGNTGPFIQYTHARIQSVLRNAKLSQLEWQDYQAAPLSEDEKSLLKLIFHFPAVVKAAGEGRNPGLIANFTYDLAKQYNQFYHTHSILSAETENSKKIRLALSLQTANILRKGMKLLGAEVPMKM
ncbi:MAG: arginine--tRNA ligase [Bacteroidetes bacterium]|nr:arginine--tRNA ligase [Bacteroidota bacterium]MBU1719802.1 arginine--tRNA ligase [Bacteroidota bacterium]